MQWSEFLRFQRRAAANSCGFFVVGRFLWHVFAYLYWLL
jgi:hypothetical protein